MSKSAVDDIIAQAMDSIALDHIAKLSTAHLSSPSLPSDLESRFRKLKSFPSSSSSSVPIPPPPPTITSSRSLPTGKENTAPVPEPAPAPAVSPPVEVVEQEKTAFQMETPSVQTKSPHKPKPSLPNLHSNGSREISLSPSKKRDPSSPTYQQGCCFPFSPKKALITSIISPKSKAKDRTKERNDELDLDNVNEWGDMNKKMVGEIKEQQRKLKKALKEQEKVSKEAAKMVRLVKHTSARMTHDINHDDLFSDNEDDDDDDHFSKI